MTAALRSQPQFAFVLALIMILLAACGAGSVAPPTAAPAPLNPVALAAGEKLRVVATTSIIGDVARQVGGDHIDLAILIAAGQDPHSYEPVAADTGAIEAAHVVFVNGLDLEESLLSILESVQGRVPVVAVSDGVDLIPLADAGGFDPHVWQDPSNVMIWADNIARALSALDPASAPIYAANANAYRAKLDALDKDITRRLSVIPADRRKLVTNHDALAYFARRYDLRLIGTVYRGADNVAEPSAGQMADLIKTIQAENANAIFVENTISPALAETIAAEVGRPIKILALYSDALDTPGAPGDTYIGMMRANAAIIVEGLSR